MPLTGISRRDTALGAFTFRELLNQKRLAERAIRRGRTPEDAKAMLAKIEEELEERRTQKLDRHPAPKLD